MTLPEDMGILDAIGYLSQNNWFWDPNGFYDNNPGIWSTYKDQEMVDYKEFKKRILQAADENAKHQVGTEWDEAEMRSNRDRENWFRVVELGIPACDVSILCSPRLETTDSGEQIIVLGERPAPGPTLSQKINQIRLGDRAKSVNPEPTFRILQGHTVENLLKVYRTDQNQSKQKIYYGIGAMAFGFALISIKYSS